jgi:hypothetical protein
VVDGRESTLPEKGFFLGGSFGGWRSSMFGDHHIYGMEGGSAHVLRVDGRRTGGRAVARPGAQGGVGQNGEDMGGFQAIWYLPPAGTAAEPSVTTEKPVAGVYRAASDHRKDGEAVGW